MEFSKQECWNELTFSPRGLPNAGIKLRSPALQADSLPTEPLKKPIEYENLSIYPSVWDFLQLLLLSHFSRVRLCNPIDGSPPGSPVPGILQQEHWSGLPFPSPMHESEKLKWNHSVMSDSEWPHGLQPTRLLCPWDFPGKSTGAGCHCLLQETSWSCPFWKKSVRTGLSKINFLPCVKLSRKWDTSCF